MRITKKDASITNTDDAFPGSFEVVLSAPTLDRDGDTLLADEWKTPLPDKITFDIDHGMSVATTVGSGVPSIDPATGNLVVRGTYSSLDRAQEVRTLVNEGHIEKTSVAFMTLPKTSKNAKPQRELLNGAFVAIPSNREAVVLDSKSLDVAAKTGARNSAADSEKIQAIHDLASSLGASHGTAADDDAPEAKSFRGLGLKAVAGSYEQTQNTLSDAVHALYPSDDVWAYPVATFPDVVVYRVSGGADTGQWQAPYTLNDDGTATLGTPERVNLVETILPASKNVADNGPDEDATDSATASDVAAAAEKSAAAATSKAAAEDDAESLAPTDEALELRMLAIRRAAFA